jgi:hypothetical protein
VPCEAPGQRARWWRSWLSNYLCPDCISPGVRKAVLGSYFPPVFRAPDAPEPPTRSFHCRSKLPCERFGQGVRWRCWWLSNYPCWDCIFRRCSRRPSHQFRPRRSFHCRSRLPCDNIGQQACWSCWWLSRYHQCIRRLALILRGGCNERQKLQPDYRFGSPVLLAQPGDA